MIGKVVTNHRTLSAALLIPFMAAGLQWLLWPYLQPLIFVFFYPAVFLASWIGGRRSGIVATLLSVGLAVFIFSAPAFTFQLGNPGSWYSAGVFVAMGFLFSYVHGRWQQANRRADVLEQLQASEAKFKAVFDNAPIGISLLDADRRLLETNDTLEHIVHIDKAGLQAGAYRNRRYIREDGTEIPASELASTRALVQNRPVRDVVNGIVLEDNQVIWTEVSAAPLNLPDRGVVVITEDITKRKQAEQRTRYFARLYATLSQVNQTIVRVKDQQVLFDAICQVAVEYGEFKLAWIGMLDRDTRQVTPVAGHGQQDLRLPIGLLNLNAEPFRSGLMGRALTGGQVEIDNDVFSDPRMAHWHDFARLHQYRSIAAIPIRRQAQIVGVLNLYAADTHFFELDEDQKLLAEMGVDISFALDTMQLEAERQQAEQALHEREELLSMMGRTAQVGGWEFNAVTGAGHWTEEVARIHDLDPAQQTNKDLGLSFYYGESRARIAAAVQAAIEQAIAYDLELEIVSAAGAHKWVRTIGHPIVENGQVVKLRGSFQDITERKQAEIALQASQEKYRSLLESLDSVIATIDAEGRFLYLNEIAARQLGGTPDHFIGRTMSQIFPEPFASQQLRDIQQVISADQPAVIQSETVIQGQLRWYRNSLQPIHDETGRAVHALLNVTDITPLIVAQHQLEEINRTLEARVAERTYELAAANASLAAANERLTELDQLKTKFVSDVSHELRTPVTSLSLYIELLEHGKPEKREQYVIKLKEQMARLRKLIDDILDLSRMEREREEGGRLPLDINAIAEHVSAMQLVAAENAGLTLTCEAAGEVPPVVARPDQLARAITNLVSNAIKYTPQGSVHVQTYVRDNRVCIEVRDTGLGIPADELPHLFGRFYRGRQVAQSTIPGTGLGLAIVKEIIESHGGTVEVESIVGQGSTFRVWLPVAHTPAT